MIERRMEVEVGDRNIPYLVFTPRTNANFEPIKIEIPGITDYKEEAAFVNEVQVTVRKKCGEIACTNQTYVSTSGILNQDKWRKVQGAVIRCGVETCPLIDPPSSGDREPLVPAPQPPVLEAEAELPL